MEKRLMTVVAGLALSTSMAFAQSQISGHVTLLRTEAQLSVLLSRLQALTQVQLPTLMVTSH